MTPFYHWLGSEADEAAVFMESYEQLAREMALIEEPDHDE